MPSDEESSHQNQEKLTVEGASQTLQSPNDSLNAFGPVLPPHLLKKESVNSDHGRKIYGPTLPDELRLQDEKHSEAAISESSSGNERTIGPEIPEHLKSYHMETKVEDDTANSDDDGNDIGPSTVLMATGEATNYYESLSRSSRNKEGPAEPNAKRETWMTELPKKKGLNFGLLPRHFKSQTLTDKECDSSVWTETPSEKGKQQNQSQTKDHSDALKTKRLEERDKEMERLVKKATKKLRKKGSLLEMHLKNMKKKKKKEAKKQEKEGKCIPERRPFDRDVDLQVRRIDESQKRAILNKSLSLNDRFSSGQSKFL